MLEALLVVGWIFTILFFLGMEKAISDWGDEREKANRAQRLHAAEQISHSLTKMKLKGKEQEFDKSQRAVVFYQGESATAKQEVRLLESKLRFHKALDEITSEKLRQIKSLVSDIPEDADGQQEE